MNNNSKRDNRIDILRGLAILSIFLAHSLPPSIIFQLRNFDVTMMAFLMGTSFYLSSQKNKDISYLTYVKKRFNRLIVPAWKFLIFFFLFFYLISILLNNRYYFSFKEIVGSFLMIQGVTYMWIMAVFFIVALVSPLLLHVSIRIKSNAVYFLLIVLAYFVYSVVIVINDLIPNEMIQTIFQNFVVNGIGYSLVAAVGIRLFKIKKNHLLIASGVFLLLFVSLMIVNGFVSTQEFKYPPTIYYFSYGLFITFLLFYLLSFDAIKKYFDIKPIRWLSRQSLDLYYYHTIPIYILGIFEGSMGFINLNFVTRFFYLLIVSLLFVFIQNTIMKTIIKMKKTEVLN